MFKVKKILSLLFCLIYSFCNAQIVQNFEIQSIRSDFTYFNFLQYNDELYIGSNIGAIKIAGSNNEETIISDQKGYLILENSKIVGNKLTAEFKHTDNDYNYLLPEKYKIRQSRYSIFKRKLYIINNGLLFIFKQTNYNTSFESLSIRSITKNYIGSYNGIFKNGIKLKYPEFTDGNIREFGNEAIICYGGIYRDSSGVISIYNNVKNGEVKIGNLEIGSARDILKLDNGNYALATNTGIYLVNFANNTAIPVYSNPNKNEFYTIFQLKNNILDNNRFYYTVKDKIYYYVVSSKEKVLVLDTKQNKDIKDIFAINLSNINVLFEDKLCKYVRNNISYLFEETIYTEDINFAHNLAFFNEMLCITTNEGTHIYDLQTNKLYTNIVPVEVNKRSLFVTNDTLKFGTLNGIISLSRQDIKNIINEQDALKLPAYNVSSEFKTYIIYFLIGLIFLIIVIGNFFFNRKIKKQTGSVPDNIITKENITKYIHENIKLVTIQSICEKFGVTPVRLYELLENDKPGEIIRNHRLNLVRRYRKEKKDDAFIAENTGFSISYLKKIY